MSINKSLLTLSFLVPLVVASATAQAGLTISDKRYLPNEARGTPPAGSVASQRDPLSAFGYDRGASRLQPMAVPSPAGTRWRYHGGPKSNY
ncbi:hypothetical protein ACFFWD_21060 [Bradyrhizobium erythrophlei]|uniref:hypothetical protein n=1 Tax=Bradyrhizobium erythrophlei TaxID=1437360 RepID=UPI0035E9549D